jgi:hypothetical protein
VRESLNLPKRRKENLLLWGSRAVSARLSGKRRLRVR